MPLDTAINLDRRRSVRLKLRRGLVKFSVGGTCPFDILQIEGLLTHGSRPGRTFGESAGVILEMDSSDLVERDSHSTPCLRYQTRLSLSSPCKAPWGSMNVVKC